MRILVFIISFFIGIIIFLPKDNLYFTLQKYLAKNNIFVNSSISASTFKLDLTKGVVFVNKMDIAKFKEITFYPFIIFNEMDAKNITLNIENLKIDNLKIFYNIFSPFKVSIIGKSNFGDIDGEIDIKSRFLKVYVLNITNSSIKSFLKKDKKGYFYYESF